MGCRSWSWPALVDTCRLGGEDPEEVFAWRSIWRPMPRRFVRRRFGWRGRASRRACPARARAGHDRRDAAGRGLKQADLDEGKRSDGLTTDEQEELRRLRRENRILREEREILKK